MQKTSSQLPFQPTRTLAGYPKRNRFRQFIMLITAFCILLSSASLLYLRQPQFASPVVVARPYNAPYDAGVFHNTVPAPVLANSDNLLIAWFKFLTNKIPEATPDFALPSEQTDLHALDKESNLIVWMGHS
ncbi:hypothetical protein [Photobacterium gaetbulicola]|uniref:hypothetical protein n=1 Tax=Photobacterium gaetbulicola TaxID=1295392 RepID=UPI0018CFBB0F|nr:hypothetical protein [Photobacterium gaetbulicola]